MSARRVMRNLTRFIEEKLGLKVDMTKSKIDRPRGLKYLGFGFYFDMHARQYKAKLHAKSVAKFKARIFDNGARLLADTLMDYPLGKDVYQLMKESHSKTICDDYDEQLDISEAVSGEHIKFHFTKEDVSNLLENVTEYSKTEKDRVATIISMQMAKYRYLFK